MEAVEAGVSAGTYSTKSGGSKPAGDIARVNRAALEALKTANGNNSHYEFGVKAVMHHCNTLFRMGAVPTEEIDLGSYIQEVANANKLEGDAFENFKRGVLQGRNLVCKQMKSQSLNNRAGIATSAGVIIGQTLSEIRNTITGEKFYDVGFQAGWKFCHNTHVYFLPYFEVLETDSLIKLFSKENKYSAAELEKFKKGFNSVTELVVKKLKEINVLIPEDKKEQWAKNGKDLAKKYYEDPDNRAMIINLYEGRSKIVEAFYNYIAKNRSLWKYAEDVSGVTDFREIKKKSLHLAVLVECFISSMNILLKENEKAIQAHKMDPEDLAKLIEEGSSEEKAAAAPSKKSSKKKKKRNRKPKVEGALNPNQGLENGEEITPVDADAKSEKELSDVKTSSSPVACAAFPKVLIVEKEGFSVPVLTVIKTILMLTDESENPINIDGEYTATQRQIFKICVLYMINSGFFNRLDLISQDDAASQLCLAIPSNDYDPRALNCKLYSREVSVFVVLREAGFTF